MRILVINWRDIRHPLAGGAEVHVHEIFRRLARKNHDVTLLASATSGLKQNESVDGVHTIRVGNWMNFNFSAAREYLSHLHKTQWDVVVDDVNKIPFYTPLYVRKPILMLVPHLFGTTVFSEVPFPQATYVYLWERAVPHVYSRVPVVAISESTKQDLVERGLDPECISVVQCGIDHEIFKPSELPVERDYSLFLYVGRVKRYKRIDLILNALASLKNDYDSLRLVVAGQGDDIARLNAVSRKLGIADRVEFRGYIDEEEKVTLLRRACALIVPSSKEGWGITAIEANACGTPVIASRSPGLIDSVKHDHSGLHVPHGNTIALAAEMRRLIDDRVLHARLVDGALKWAATFSWDNATEEMLVKLEKAAGRER